MNNPINFEATHGNKVDNESELKAQEWNDIMKELDTVIAQIPTGGDGSGSGTQSVADTHISKSAKGNIEFVTTQEDLNTEGKGGKINIESYSDIQIKPGDDVIFTSSHRPVKNLDEVSIKIHDGQDHPVKLQVNTADIVLTTKDKGSTKTKNDDGSDTTTAMYNDPAVLNVTVNSAKDTRGYLKVRAQAIDLRSESHGGIALQPKGADNTGTTLNTIATGIYTSNEAAVGYYFDLTHSIYFDSAGLYQIIDPNNCIPSGGTAKLAFMDSSFHSTSIAEKDITLPYTLTSEELITLNQGGYKLFVYIIEGDTQVIQNVSDNLYIVKVTRKENKIKFEHGGGDGLEFGTFNSQRTSIFTDEYRFNQNGTILLSSRIKEQSDKADPDDDTTTYKYQKQADDFYDIIGGRRDVTWRDVVTIIGELKDMKRNHQGPWANS